MDNNLYKAIGEAVRNAEKNGGDLTTKNLRYVWKVADSISQKTGVDVHDLFVEGVIAMRKCEQKYDPSKNDNFVKYCATSIRGYMLNVVNRQQDIVHIPVNHKKGFAKGQEQKEGVSDVSYTHIDAMDYDTLGYVDPDCETRDREEILNEGIKRLDINGQIAMKMKLRIGEYSSIEKNNMHVIADELEVPVPIANKIYKEALKKLTKYCQSEIGA